MRMVLRKPCRGVIESDKVGMTGLLGDVRELRGSDIGAEVRIWLRESWLTSWMRESVMQTRKCHSVVRWVGWQGAAGTGAEGIVSNGDIRRVVIDLGEAAMQLCFEREEGEVREGAEISAVGATLKPSTELCSNCYTWEPEVVFLQGGNLVTYTFLQVFSRV